MNRQEYHRQWRRKNPDKVLANKRKENAKKRKNKRFSTLMKTATYLGRTAELSALNFLQNSKDMNENKFCFRGYDILWNGKRINVKSSLLPKKRDYWTFGILNASKNHSQCDFALCMCYLNENGQRKLGKVYLIPSDEYTKGGISIYPQGCKWDKYILDTGDKS